MKEEREKLTSNEEEKQSGEVSRRDFLVGAGTVVVGGAIGAGLLSSCSGDTVTTTVTSTKTVPTTVTTTVGGSGATVTETKTVGAGETVTATKTVTQPGGGALEPWQEPETIVPGAYGTDSSAACIADVKNGKLIRLRPFNWDYDVTEEEMAAAEWECTIHGKTYKSYNRSQPSWFALAYKKRIYSPGRVLYPVQRVDWEPGGDPAKMNTQNRGISKYKRISWDDAASIIASEIKRVQDTYGVFSCLFAETPAHRETKVVHWPGNIQGRMLGGAVPGEAMFSEQVRNADSWEGYYWGLKWLAGEGNVGAITPTTNNFLDVAENSEMVVIQGADRITTGKAASCRSLDFLHKLGTIKHVYVAPDCNYQNAAYPGKWIPILPNTDIALSYAIVYTWLVEDTWDKEYVDSHVVGMDYIRDYAMGDVDGVPKTPEWASKRTGIPEWTIKALARAWAKYRTTAGHGTGGHVRGAYSHEEARMTGVLMGMQGLGKPGQQWWGGFGGVSPSRTASTSVGSARTPGRACRQVRNVRSKQFVPKTMVHLSILDHGFDNPMSWYGHTANAELRPDQLLKFTYPIPKDEGGAEIHLFWNDKPCNIGCWNDGRKLIEAFRSPKLECLILQQQWFSGDCVFGDIILPINTAIEEDDLCAAGGDQSVVFYKPRAIEPIGESKSDYEATLEVAYKLQEYGGRYANVVQNLTDGMSFDELIKFGYDGTQMAKEISWEEFQKKSYLIAPVNPDWQKAPAGLSKFYNDPTANPRDTESGKLEFYSQTLADNFPDDEERGPYPRYVIGGPNPDWTVNGPGWYHDESLDVENGAERCKTYPYPLVTNHPHWRVHVQCDDIPWFREIEICKMIIDGYAYEPVWINPIDAEKKGIKHGDIVKIYNDRGIDLGGAYVSQRIIPGAVYQDHGAREDFISSFPDECINRGGTNQQISPLPGVSRNCWGMASQSFLVNIEKLDPAEMEAWKTQHPEIFERASKWNPYIGYTFADWVEEGGA